MKKLSILYTVIFGVGLIVTGCGRPDDTTATTAADQTLPKLSAAQVNDLQQFAIDHPDQVPAPPVMPSPTEAGSRGIYLRFTPNQVNRIYGWAQNLWANGDPRAGRVSNWFNHIVSVKCARFPNGPVCSQYGGN